MYSGCPSLHYKKSVSVHPVHGNPRTGLPRTFWDPDWALGSPFQDLCVQGALNFLSNRNPTRIKNPKEVKELRAIGLHRQRPARDNDISCEPLCATSSEQGYSMKRRASLSRCLEKRPSFVTPHLTCLKAVTSEALQKKRLESSFPLSYLDYDAIEAEITTWLIQNRFCNVRLNYITGTVKNNYVM